MTLQQQQQQQEQMAQHAQNGYMPGYDAVVDVAPSQFFKEGEGLQTLADVSVRTARPPVRLVRRLASIKRTHACLVLLALAASPLVPVPLAPVPLAAVPFCMRSRPD